MNLWSLAGGLLCFCLAALPGARPWHRVLRICCGVVTLACGFIIRSTP